MNHQFYTKHGRLIVGSDDVTPGIANSGLRFKSVVYDYGTKEEAATAWNQIGSEGWGFSRLYSPEIWYSYVDMSTRSYRAIAGMPQRTKDVEDAAGVPAKICAFTSRITVPVENTDPGVVIERLREAGYAPVLVNGEILLFD